MNETRLREIVTTIDRQLLRLAADETPNRTKDDLAKSIGELVGLLALGPEPELRTCPECSRRVRREATRCGFCWVRLMPLA